jgi:RNA polymerase sigma-70 factor (ECF subfamily)
MATKTMREEPKRVQTASAPLPPEMSFDEPDDPTMVALVDRMVAVRDSEAFGKIYDRLVDRVYRYLYFRTATRTDAEDLTEEVFLRAWEGINGFRWQGKPFLAWLYRLAHNAHIDHLRRQRPTSSLDDPESPIHLACEATSRELVRRLDADMLARAVARLTPDQQQVIILRFIEGLDTVQIARIMERGENTTRALQMRALRSLRRALSQQHEETP